MLHKYIHSYMQIYVHNKDMAYMLSKGPKGDTGSPGPKGEIGYQGLKGDKGDGGSTGAKGELGL